MENTLTGTLADMPDYYTIEISGEENIRGFLSFAKQWGYTRIYEEKNESDKSHIL